MIITDEQIERAKLCTRYGNRYQTYHDHPDCIRLAVEWLAAQRRIKNPGTHRHGLKHYVESWAGRYVSADDVCVAGTLLGLKGRCPCFDISSRLTRPNLSRLEGIGEAMTHKGYLLKPYYTNVYAFVEAEPSTSHPQVENGNLHLHHGGSGTNHPCRRPGTPFEESGENEMTTIY